MGFLLQKLLFFKRKYKGEKFLKFGFETLDAFAAKQHIITTRKLKKLKKTINCCSYNCATAAQAQRKD